MTETGIKIADENFRTLDRRRDVRVSSLVIDFGAGSTSLSVPLSGIDWIRPDSVILVLPTTQAALAAGLRGIVTGIVVARGGTMEISTSASLAGKHTVQIAGL